MRFRSAHLLWAALALSALALILSGCGAAAHKTGSSALRSTGTPTATSLAPLTWTQVKLPTSFTSTGENLSISPADGHDAWMCQSISANTYAIWKTTDAGQSWRQTGRFNYTAPMAGASCSLSADQAGTSALLATIGWGCGECGNLASASLFSADGATHWRPLSGYVQGPEFATVRGGFIAIVSKTVASPQGAMQYLAFSSDGFQTWRAMSPQGLPTQFFHFAVSPDGSTLIGSGFNGTLWRSTDLGAHWTQLPSLDSQVSLVTWIPQHGAFLMCGGDAGDRLHRKCSTDLGAHWTLISLPTYIYNCDNVKCGPSTGKSTVGCPPVAITADGSLIATCPSGEVSVSVNPDRAPADLYLLRLGATTWQNLGAVPGGINMASATGPIWCANTTADQLLGYSTGQLPG